MIYSDRAGAFLELHGMSPPRVKLGEATSAFLADMELGLHGRQSSISMLPTYLRAPSAPPFSGKAAVIDAGGTFFRTALVSYEGGHPAVESFSATAMPGSAGCVDWDEFIRFAAERLSPLTRKADAVGFCFSYPTEETPERDGRLIRLTKQVKLSGWEGRLICADLSAALSALGAPALPFVLLNDTPATLLSGAHLMEDGKISGLVGLISGTGTNTCCCLPDSAIKKSHGFFTGDMLVNLESGNFDGLPAGDFDRQLDAATDAPGFYLHEKMTGGAYLGELCRLTMRAAALEGLFTDAGADAVLNLAALDSQDADRAVNGTWEAVNDAEDARLAGDLCAALFERAARCVCANLAAILILTGAGENADSPACICADGSMFKKNRTFRAALKQSMDAFVGETLGRSTVFHTSDNATILGAAAAALLNKEK